MIENIVEKLIRTEKRISEEKGDFNFFGLFKRADLEGAWDIIISAPWFSDNKRNDLVYIIGEIKKDLLIEDLRLLARVVLIEPEDGLTGRDPESTIVSPFAEDPAPAKAIIVTVLRL